MFFWAKAVELFLVMEWWSRNDIISNPKILNSWVPSGTEVPRQVWRAKLGMPAIETGYQSECRRHDRKNHPQFCRTFGALIFCVNFFLQGFRTIRFTACLGTVVPSELFWIENGKLKINFHFSTFNLHRPFALGIGAASFASKALAEQAKI